MHDDIKLSYIGLTDNEVRWDKDTRIIWLNQAVKEIRYIRGDSAITDWDEEDYEPYSDSTKNDLILADIFQNDIINYIVWKCYLMDSEDELNVAQAASWEATFKRGIGA